jgi:DNA primase
MSFSQHLLETIKQVARIEEVAADFVRVTVKGSKVMGDCPDCGTAEKITITKGKNIAKCFKCGEKAVDPLGFVQHYGKMTFPEAVRWMAKKYNLEHMLEDEQPVAAPVEKKPKSEPTKPQERTPKLGVVTKPSNLKKKTFRDISLEASGITLEMQRMPVWRTGPKGEREEMTAFDRYTDGTIDYQRNWEVIPGNDMLMRYVDLEGKPMLYQQPKGNRMREMVRVRFENPELHNFSSTAKYISPRGSGLHLWLPNKLIKEYQAGGYTTKVLTIQEGEKKADRVNNAVPSVGIMGIHSMVAKDGQMPREFEMIINRMEVETVVFFMDADLFELGRKADEPVDGRPWTFARAVQKFRHHFYKFQREGRRLNLLLAYPKTLEQGIKGMDDLLQSPLLNDEGLREAIHGGILGRKHEVLAFHDITLWTDAKIADLWHLSSHQDFAEHYKEKIKARNPEDFLIGRMRYRFNQNGELELAQPMASDETFYEVKTKGRNEERYVHFSNTMLLNFLEHRGYWRYREPDGQFGYIHEEDNLVGKVDEIAIRDFVNDFLKVHERNIMVRDYFLHNWEQFLYRRTFSSLTYKEPLLLRDERARKHFIFANGIWNVTETGVEHRALSDMNGSIWKDSLIKEKPKYCGELFRLKLIDDTMIRSASGDYRRWLQEHRGRYTFEMTEEGEKCVFLQFLLNTSDFYWEKEEKAFQEKYQELRYAHPDKSEDELEVMANTYMAANPVNTIEERMETQQHLIAKLTAIGHMLHQFRSPHSDYWIYAMEGNLIEGQRSEGRSGKSLIPKMLENVVQVVNTNGRKDIDRDIYFFAKVTEETQIVHIDDYDRCNDVQKLFPRQTGDFGVRGMNKEEVFIPYEKAPKGYVSSNYNLLGSDGSTRDRWKTILFSDFYSADRKPADIHGHLFFIDWDETQKSLFYTLMAECVRAYFKCGGVVLAPSDRADARRWLQEIGNDFKEWADRTFIVPSANAGDAVRTGYKIPKLVALGMDGKEEWSFYAKYPKQREYVKEQQFKRKLWLWCLLNKLEINPGKTTTLKSLSEFHGLKYGGDDKAGGTEWFTIIEPGQAVVKGPYESDKPEF